MAQIGRLHHCLVEFLERPQPPRYLNGWKAIASYLGRDQSTVRRWAGSAGLPVHRPQSGTARRGAVVYALAQELDAWITRFSRDVSPEFEPAQTDSAAAKGKNEQALTGVQQDPSPSEAAQALYLEGVYLWQKRTTSGLTAAEQRMQAAIALAPNYAAAHAELAIIYDMMVDYGVLSQSIGYDLAQAAAQHALSLDPTSARAVCVLADISFYGRRDFSGSLELYRQATELDPQDPLCHHWYAAALSLSGDQTRARQEVLKAKTLYPSSRQVIYTEAMNLLGKREFASARRLLLDLVTNEPDFANPYRLLAFAELGLGDFPAYLSAWHRHLALRGDTDSCRVIEAAQSADEICAEAAGRVLAAPNGSVEPYLSAHARALTGDWRSALSILGQVSDCSAFYNAVDPAFTLARQDPQFRAELQNVQLPPV